jgi:predicted XRE-type DNA-binding protein
MASFSDFEPKYPNYKPTDELWKQHPQKEVHFNESPPDDFFTQLGKFIKETNSQDDLEKLVTGLASAHTYHSQINGFHQKDVSELFSITGISDLQGKISKFQKEWNDKPGKGTKVPINFHDPERGPQTIQLILRGLETAMRSK